MIELQEKQFDSPTNSRALVVQRRFPTYDFVAPALLSVAEASKRLDDFLSNEASKPRRFVLRGPRVSGSIGGSTFTLWRETGFGDSMTPFAEGYLVPAEIGSNVYVRVQLPASWWAFEVLVLASVFVNFGWTLKGAAAATATLLVLLGVRAASIAFEASQLARVLQRVLAPGRGS
jgi:hypothetical protein